MSQTVYRVVVTREGESWLADVPELEGAHTWARTLKGLQRAVREVIVLAEGLPDAAEASLDLEFDVQTGVQDLDEDAAALPAARTEEAQRAGWMATETRRLAQAYLAAGFSLRDTAAVLGISHQLIAQLVERRAPSRSLATGEPLVPGRREACSTTGTGPDQWKKCRTPVR